MWSKGNAMEQRQSLNSGAEQLDNWTSMYKKMNLDTGLSSCAKINSRYCQYVSSSQLNIYIQCYLNHNLSKFFFFLCVCSDDF